MPRLAVVRRILMRIAPEIVFSTDLKPLCSRDDHVMRYESIGSRNNTGFQASYFCGSRGCEVRYTASDGYFVLNGTPNHTYGVDEPGVNTLRCPLHNTWLYRQDSMVYEPGVRWRCAVQGCTYAHEALTKGDWLRA
jgi:hypothetical protein